MAKKDKDENMLHKLDEENEYDKEDMPELITSADNFSFWIVVLFLCLLLGYLVEMIYRKFL